MVKLGKVLVALFLLAVLIPLDLHAEAAEVYTVRPGDTLWKISVRYQVKLSEIIAANPQIKDPHWIYPGDKVTIPLIDEIKQAENQVVYLVNQERAKNGLSPLKINWEVARVARYKSMDMRDKGYFSHQSPTYGSPFEMLRVFGITFSSAGENIAAGQRTPQEVVKSWMESTGHRQNILSPRYSQIGVGLAKGGSYGYYWTQMFIHE